MSKQTGSHPSGVFTSVEEKSPKNIKIILESLHIMKKIDNWYKRNWIVMKFLAKVSWKSSLLKWYLKWDLMAEKE